MQKLAFEHQFRFSKLHEKRAEVMAELYRLLVVTEKDCQRFTLDVVLSNEDQQHIEELLRAAAKSADKLKSYFGVNQIYFDESLCVVLKSFVDESFKVAVYYYESSEKISAREKDALKNFWDKSMNEIPLIKREIENNFRMLMGNMQS